MRRLGWTVAFSIALISAAFAQGSSPSLPQYVTGNTGVNTYNGGVSAAANSSAGDVYCIFGSATKIVKVKRISISGIASAAIINSVIVVKRSTADTGGTPTAVTLVPNDSANPAATATATVYATAPTPGTLVGIVRSSYQAIPTTSNANAHEDKLEDFTSYWDQPIVLRGVNQSLCLTIPATAGGTWNINHEHTEE
jgi:hypothetical protein